MIRCRILRFLDWVVRKISNNDYTVSIVFEPTSVVVYIVYNQLASDKRFSWYVYDNRNKFGSRVVRSRGGGKIENLLHDIDGYVKGEIYDEIKR